MYDLALIIISLLVVFFFNYIGMKNFDRQWYDNLNKPSWTPSGQFIGVMWFIIYITVGISWYLALKNIESSGLKTLISIIFIINLAFNISWSNFFFNQQNIIVPLGIIGILIFTLLMLIILIYPYSLVGALLLFIYLIWLFIAGYLNYYIVQNK
jgi:translocator protein